MRILLIFFFFSTLCYAQTNNYHISFDNAQHHEAKIQVSFPELTSDTLRVRMSRTSPGRYALHEFAKNVYSVQATNSKGEPLEILRPDPYSWKITGHDGTVQVSYILFANRGDGTYSQIDNTHAHLNIPATFMYSEALKDRPIEVKFETGSHPEWQVATQLKSLGNNTFYAPDLYYFMDSPTEISDFDHKDFEVNGQQIRFVLHHPGTEQDFEEYFQKVKKIVLQQREVFDELPQFDFGKYSFLACYMPNASGDGMEHRNSTVLTSATSLEEGGMEENIGTVSHEFFHAWNVERIRPRSLEPFDFSEANMSGALWFAEGFTSYYTRLILSRAGIITPADYVEGLNGTFNYVWNSPGLEYFNPIEMSYQAPFVDAATSVDPVNRENTFISYYSYGNMLGLALDLALRKKGLNLDDYMKAMWIRFGKPEKPYTLKDLEETLADYAGEQFSKHFFESHIRNSGMPDYQELFATVGLTLRRGSENPYFGPALRETPDGVMISDNPKRNTPAYLGGLDKGDILLTVNGHAIANKAAWEAILKGKNPGEELELEILRYGTKLKKEITLGKDPTYTISINEDASLEAKKSRKNWLVQPN